ncbi:MAG: PHB depolymerase family esterase [Burkholderiaceae bacterium]
MNLNCPDLMTQAARLTRAGDLKAATAVIQQALHRSVTADRQAATQGNVIDVEAHEVIFQGFETSAEHAPAQQPVNEARPPSLFVDGSFTEKSGTRAYKLFIPPTTTTTNDALPLIVMLHGCTQNPDDFAAGTGMNELAGKRGFYVLYPEQARHANSSACWNWFKHNHQARGQGEPAILAGMTRDVMSRYEIDPKCVYVAGLSAGGAMAAILGDAYPDIFAAVGVHSGLPTGSATNMPAALSVMKSGAATPAHIGSSPPTIVFHGDKDTTVHPINGVRVAEAIAGQTPSDSSRARSGNGREFTRRIYRRPDGRVIAEHWIVHGAGHAWSGGSARGSHTDSGGPSASEEMLRFFFATSAGSSTQVLHAKA